MLLMAYIGIYRYSLRAHGISYLLLEIYDNDVDFPWIVGFLLVFMYTCNVHIHLYFYVLLNCL